jgi:hypothetical protein
MINPNHTDNSRIFMPANRNVRCDTNDNAAGGSVAFTSPSGAGTSFNWTGLVYYQVLGGSWFWCQFRGPNYNAAGAPIAPGYTSYKWFEMGPSVSNITFAANDFNGPGGANGAILILDPPNSIQPSYIVTEYNTFEHCGMRDEEMDSGNNYQFIYNTSSDCGSGSEVQGTQWPKMTNNLWANNTWYMPNGSGYCHNSYLSNNSECSGNQITAGLACHDPNTWGVCNSSHTQDYLGNTMEFNILDSTGGAGIGLAEANSTTCGNGIGNIIPGVYISNKCQAANNCTISCPPSSPGSNQ